MVTQTTVQSCIKQLNNENFYAKNIQNSIFSKLRFLNYCLSIIKYESYFYLAHGIYTRTSNEIIESLKNKIEHKILLTPNKQKIDCWDINPKKYDNYIIICNGIGNEKSNPAMQNAYLKFIENGWGVLAFDYRGRGKSDGFFCQKNAYEDTLAVWHYLQNKGINNFNITILGHSLGAGVAIDFASKHPMAQVILVNPFNKAADMVRHFSTKLLLPTFIKKSIKNMPDFLIPIKNKFKNDDYLKKVYAPTLILHNKQDNTIPVGLCRKLYSKNKDKNNLTYLEMDGHNHEIDNDKIEICLNFMKNSHLWLFNKTR